MCGIAGAIAIATDGKAPIDAVERMSKRLIHRGPDGDGLWVSPSGRACLAHRRLSVIDLATGAQPMVGESGRFGLVFNGEIYNYLELKSELQRAGHRFSTTSDTEVLLRLAATRGADAVHALRGMFAFAAWDDAAGSLTLARDRIGKKPMYYAIENGVLYFSSALSSLRASGVDTGSIDPEALDLYLTLGYIPAPFSIFRNIRKLQAGHVATLNGGTLRSDAFWSLDKEPEPFQGSYEQALDRLEELLTESLGLRLRSDVPLGVFLSGGIDSSLVTAMAAATAPSQVHTFSIGFDDRRYDESGFAAEVASALGTQHRTLTLDHTLPDLLPDMVRHFGEPYADASAMPMWALSKLARPHVTVALGGDGGDEGFAGYSWYRTAATLGRLARGMPAPVARFAADVLAQAGPSSPRLLARAERALRPLGVSDPAIRFARLRRLVDPGLKRRLLAGHSEDRTDELIGGHYRRAEGSALRRMRSADIATYLADQLMTKVDVASMAHGLEVRAPLLDQEILRFGLSLPDAFLMDKRGGKRPLRDLLARRVPTVSFDRPKSGFTPPFTAWIRGQLRPNVEALSTSERLASVAGLSLPAVGDLVDEHLAHKRDHGERLFSLIILDAWLAQEAG